MLLMSGEREIRLPGRIGRYCVRFAIILSITTGGYFESATRVSRVVAATPSTVANQSRPSLVRQLVFALPPLHSAVRSPSAVVNRRQLILVRLPSKKSFSSRSEMAKIPRLLLAQILPLSSLINVKNSSLNIPFVVLHKSLKDPFFIRASPYPNVPAQIVPSGSISNEIKA